MFLNNPAMYLFIILIFPSGKKIDTDEIIPELQNLICEPYYEQYIRMQLSGIFTMNPGSSPRFRF